MELLNRLNVNGEIFNNSFKLSFKNDFLEKKSLLDLEFNNLNKRFIHTLNFNDPTKVGNISYLDSRKKYDTIYTLEKNIIKFNSDEKIGDNFFYSGNLKFSPFSAFLEINLKEIHLKKLLSDESFFIDVLKSNIFINENLNFNILVKSKNISDHRRLKNFNLNINYENQLLNFDNSNLLFEDILQIRLVKSEFKNTKKNQYFVGEFEIIINDYPNLYSFFQTKKENRKKIDSANLVVKYDFFKNSLSFEKLEIDGAFNENMKYVVNQFNQENKTLKNRIDLRNFFNSIIEEL